MTISQVIRLFILGRGKEKYDSLQSLPSILRLTWDILNCSNKPGSKDSVWLPHSRVIYLLLEERQNRSIKRASFQFDGGAMRHESSVVQINLCQIFFFFKVLWRRLKHHWRSCFWWNGGDLRHVWQRWTCRKWVLVAWKWQPCGLGGVDSNWIGSIGMWLIFLCFLLTSGRVGGIWTHTLILRRIG